MEDQICNWTPQIIVELIKEVAWPLVILFIGLKFRSVTFGAIRDFFSHNTVSEVSASTSGVTAKFVAAKQATEALESAGSNAINLPNDMTADAIKCRHEHHRTEFSEELYESIKTHLSALKISHEEKIEILAREASLLQSAIRYFDINKVLFRSQFNLFSIMANNSGYIDSNDAQRNFQSVREIVGDAFSDWDWIKYIAYPVSTGLIIDEEGGYKLTMLGESYVSFMSRNPQLVDELAKI